MHSYFDLLVLAALFVPMALMVFANLLAYRSEGAGEGLLAVPPVESAAEPLPARSEVATAAVEAEELHELREAA